MKSLLFITAFLLIQAREAFCQNGKMENKIITNEMYVPTTSDKAMKYYNQGNTDVDARNFRSAVTNFKMAIAADTNYIDAYDNLGIAFRQLGELDSAERYYLMSVRKYPKGTVAVRNLAVVEEMRKNHDKAIKYYKQALAIDPKDAEAYYGLTRQYLMLGKYSEALVNADMTEKYYKEMNSPYIGDCYFTKCTIYIMMDNKEMGRKYMNLAREAGMTIAPQISDALK